MLSMLRCCSNRITFPIQTKIFSRKFMTVSEKMEILLRQRDHIPRDYRLIYRDRNQTFVGFSYHAINFLAWMTAGTLGYFWYNDIPFHEKAQHWSLTESPGESVIMTIGVISVFTVSLWIRRRFVLRVYFSEKEQKYKAIFIGRVPFTCEYREFPPKSVTFASKNTDLPWRNTVFKINRRKVYFFEDNFRTHADFLEMLHPEEESS